MARQEADPKHSQKPTNIIDNEQSESSKLNDKQMDPEPVDSNIDLYEPEPEQVDEDGQIQEQQMEPIVMSIQFTIYRTCQIEFIV